MQRTCRRGLMGLVVAIAACAQLAFVEGPSRPDVAAISSIVITALESDEQKPRAVNDPTKVQAILSSPAFSKAGWVRAGGRQLVPLYRIDLRARQGVAAVYWLGTNSHPPEFPCYALCSGWWLAASGPSGDLDHTRYKQLPDSASLLLVRDLGLR